MEIAEDIKTIQLDVEEVKQLAFDFTNELNNPAATIMSPVITAEVLIGTDPAPIGVLTGGFTISGKQILQKVKGNALEVTYHVRCKVTDSDGLVHTLAVNIAVKRF